MAVVGGAHLACAKGREARADASLREDLEVVDATIEGSRSERVRRRCGGFSTGRSAGLRSAGREARRGPHDDRHLGSVVTADPSPGARETGLGPRVKPQAPRVRRGPWCLRSGCTEPEAGAIVPEGDASEPLYLARDMSSTPRCQRLVSVSGKALPAHEARRVGRRVREDACIGTGQPKRMAVNNPITLPGPNHANGWAETDGDIPAER
jgi:hypothetical protein